MGQSILDICLTMHGRKPFSSSSKGIKGGILVFFPSYPLMANFCDRWKQTGLYDRLKSVVGSLLVEPRGNGKQQTHQHLDESGEEFPASSKKSGFMTVSNKKGADNSSTVDDSSHSIVDQFDKAIAQYGGCVLLAVCRGKVSEGIDFSDNKGRVVIITGLPYAPLLDPWVVLKKQYLDERFNGISMAMVKNPQSMGPSATNRWSSALNQVVTTSISNPSLPANALQSSVTTSGKGISGQTWYEQSAVRAVNQCLGRVIRHRKDWGAIFLLDDRFSLRLFSTFSL